MKRKLNGIDITYRYSRGSDATILLLHGWGGNLNSFRSLENYLKSENFSVICIDFPGFGGSEMPVETWTIFDYYKVVSELLKVENIKSVSIVAHSFGGRVALLLASHEPEKVEKLVLVDSAGLVPKFSLTKSIKILNYKICKRLKKIGIIKRDLINYGSDDYKAMPNRLKPVFNRIINTDLSYTLNGIKCPTIIIWGKDDRETPMYMAKKFNKYIKDSAIIKLDGGHFCYLQNAKQFQLIVLNFLR